VSGERPLQGLRVIAVSQYGAGPFATLHLADLGADVIKIEDPSAGGDVGRSIPPYAEGGDSLFYQALNRGKRSVALDLRSPAGAEVLGDLVAVSDALLSNLRGDGPAKLGLTYELLGRRNPRIVCCSLSGYGMTGSRASEPAFDYLVQAELGYMALTGEPGGPPARSGVSVVDWAAGYAAAFGLLAGVQQAQRTGRGADLDLSLYEIGLAMHNYVASWHLSRGYVPERLAASAHPSLVPSQLFATADGHLFVMCNKESFWTALCEVIERPELAAEDRFATAADRLAHREQLVAILEPVLARRTNAEWLALLRGVVPVAVPRSLPEALADDFLREREDLVEVEHPELGTLTQIATPFRFDGDVPDYRPASGLGADTEDVLSELLGYDTARLAALRAAGAVSGPGRAAG
jgi:crotonobetainyl-CoA:carnitine CoA-transferase CaiB-like acyl-CoA transferase